MHAWKRPSAEIEEQIDRLLALGVGENPRESLSELAKLGARLIIQRAVEEELDAWLGRARYERRPDCQRGCATAFAPASCRPPRASLRSRCRRSDRRPSRSSPSSSPEAPSCSRTEPLRAMVIGAFVRGLSMRDVESLCEQPAWGSCAPRRPPAPPPRSRATSPTPAAPLPRGLRPARGTTRSARPSRPGWSTAPTFAPLPRLHFPVRVPGSAAPRPPGLRTA
jgi:hypothetical protein